VEQTIKCDICQKAGCCEKTTCSYKLDIVECFYQEYLGELKKHLKQVDIELELFGEIYLRNLNKKNSLFVLANAVIGSLLTEKEFTENAIERISARHKADSPMVTWHKN